MLNVLGWEFLPTTWLDVVLALIATLLGGHGLFVTLTRNRQETVKGLMDQVKGLMDLVNSQSMKIADLSKSVGNNEGKIEILERQIEHARHEKHKFRNLAHKYKLLCEGLRRDLLARDRRIAQLEGVLKSSPDSPLHPLEEPQA